MLKIEHLKKSYENFSLDCSLEIKRGHVTGLIGPFKSTMARSWG